MARRTLRQAAVLAGYATQKALVDAASQRGLRLAHSAVSDMFRGGPSYPRAREALARVLFRPRSRREVDRAVVRLLALIRNSAA